MADKNEVTVADVLRRGAERIRTNGWCRWSSWEGDATCSIIALGRASADLTGSDALGVTANSVLARYVGAKFTITWNEEVAIDGEHVAQTFEKAAAAWEEVAGL